jgi:hypothetical protein
MKAGRIGMDARGPLPAAMKKKAKRLRTWHALAAQDRAERSELFRAMRRVKERLIESARRVFPTALRRRVLAHPRG